MRRIAPTRCSLIVLPLLWVMAPAARAATVIVQVGGSFAAFSPQTAFVEVGDTVRWVNDGGFHDVTADDHSFGNTASSDAWTFEHTYGSAGSFGYHCSIHGAPGGGMFGTVVVGDAPPNTEPGFLGFSLGAYSVAEGAGVATITVQRLSGDDGGVGVEYGATAGTATGGQDFTTTGGTLFWANGDSASKTFTVAITSDSAVEGSETVQLQLSNPSGGAMLDPARDEATLTILDDDVPGSPPGAPSGLVATPQSSSSIVLAWSDNASNETEFRIERRTVDGGFAQVATAAANATGATLTGLDPSTFYFFRVRAANGAGVSAYSNEASATTLGAVAPCVAGPETLCINGGRFAVELDWRIPDGTGGHGQAVPVPSAPDSGLFYFFGPSNIEMLIKVLDACVPALGNRYWTFFAATTNVEFVVVVTDTSDGATKSYYNPLNRPAPPVQDTDAFATCP
jgi:plastocyanin